MSELSGAKYPISITDWDETSVYPLADSNYDSCIDIIIDTMVIKTFFQNVKQVI